MFNSDHTNQSKCSYLLPQTADSRDLKTTTYWVTPRVLNSLKQDYSMSVLQVAKDERQCN